jgi:hypothetical protein
MREAAERGGSCLSPSTKVIVLQKLSHGDMSAISSSSRSVKVRIPAVVLELLKP